MSLFPRAAESALANVPRSKGSKVFVVDYVNGSDSNPGTKWDAPLKTIEAAYALTTDLKNDTILLVGNGTSNVAAAAITWSNSYTHLIGLSAPGLMEPRSRIKPTAALATTPFVTWSGSGCIVRNISFWHETSDAAGLVNVLVSGGRNYFESCQFAGAVGANAVTGARSLKISGANGGNTFKDCVIGNDTVAVPNGGAGLELVTGAMHNKFTDCIFNVSTDGTTYAHVTAAAAAGVGRLNVFRGCLFVNEGSGTMASVFVIGAALPASSYIYALDCWQIGATDWNHDNNGLITNITIAANTTGVNSGNKLIITSS
jgi:hypothetical protein